MFLIILVKSKDILIDDFFFGGEKRIFLHFGVVQIYRNKSQKRIFLHFGMVQIYRNKFQKREVVGVGQRWRETRGKFDTAQDRCDGGGESGEIGDNQSVPLQHVHPQVQEDSGGDASRGFQRFRHTIDPGHPGYIGLVRVPRDERSVHQVCGRVYPRVRRPRRQHVPRGENAEGANS